MVTNKIWLDAVLRYMACLIICIIHYIRKVKDMRAFGTDEFGDKNGFKVICQRCGREARVIPTHYLENGKTIKITLGFRCICGNKYGATIDGK